MSKKFYFSARNCLEWSTEKPFSDGSRRSPTFSYLGREWYFRLNACPYAKYTKYTFNIYHAKDEQILNEVAELTVFIYCVEKQCIKHLGTLKFPRYCLCDSKDIDIPDDDLYGHWIIYCTFSTDLPSQLHIKSSKTMYLQNVPALPAQHSSTQNDIVMKAKLAANAPDGSLSGLENLCFDFNKLLDKKPFSDVILICEDSTFPAHRIILAARSDVFAAMFRNRMTECETGVINITDTDSEVLDLLLRYVYTGKVSDLYVDSAFRLYMAADKYSITSLKNECSKFMLGHLTVENCLNFLLADACSDNRFKGRLINFIAEILNLIGEPWQKFIEKYPQLAFSVYQRYESITKKVKCS